MRDNLRRRCALEILNGEPFEPLIAGRDLRRLMRDRGIKLSGPSFYAMMYGMGQDGLVIPMDIRDVEYGVKLRHFYITQAGQRYLSEPPPPEPPRKSFWASLLSLFSPAR